MTTLYKAVYVALLYIGLLYGTPIYAQPNATDPLFVWSISRGCQPDAELTRAVVDRLQLLGPPLYTLGPLLNPAARTCTGTDCAALLADACAGQTLNGGRILGGHVDEKRDGDRYFARIRMFRTDLTDTAPKSFYRWEYLQLSCAPTDCQRQLADLLATMIGQLLEDLVPVTQAATNLDNAPPPYCFGRAHLPVFLCAPANLRSRCGTDLDTQSGNISPMETLRCPLSGSAAGGHCDCAAPASCTGTARAACPVSKGPENPESPILLRKALGGSLLVAGGATLLTALLLTLNNYSDLTLRRDVSCSAGGGMVAKCYAAPGGVGAAWVLGAGLTLGGALVLSDPLRLFAASPKVFPK